MKLGMDIVFEQQKDCFLLDLQHDIFLIQDSSGYFQIILVYSFAHNGFSVIFNDNVDLYKMAWKLASKMGLLYKRILVTDLVQTTNTRLGQFVGNDINQPRVYQIRIFEIILRMLDQHGWVLHQMFTFK